MHNKLNVNDIEGIRKQTIFWINLLNEQYNQKSNLTDYRDCKELSDLLENLLHIVLDK